MKRKNKKLKIKKATQLLNKMAPKGEKLAYINNREAELLKRMGGAGKNINETGIKSYYYDEVGQTMGGTGFQDTSHLTGGRWWWSTSYNSNYTSKERYRC
jgi:hypothetical protein